MTHATPMLSVKTQKDHSSAPVTKGMKGVDSHALVSP